METAVVVLRLESVTKRVVDGRGRRTVLREVSFELSAASTTILRGASGSGKTTLLAIAGALLTPTSGEVFIDGEATSRLRDRFRAELRREKVGFVFQELALIAELSAIENILLPAVPLGVSAAHRARALALIERFGLSELADQKARSLSGGERQRVALARALLHKPKLLLLDEPSAHLDDARTDELTKMLAEFTREGAALLIATHDPRMYHAGDLARLLSIHDGAVSEGASLEASHTAGSSPPTPTQVGTGLPHP
jgi:ABC-type lipoprotein export system ATPase subunit